VEEPLVVVPPPPATPVDLTPQPAPAAAVKKNHSRPSVVYKYEPRDAEEKFVVDTLVGQHVNPYPFIPFPPEVPPRPAPGHRTIMVVVLTGFADWGEFTMPLLTYLASCPDSIDVVALGKADNVDLSKSASQLNYSVLPAADSSPDRASLINQAWAHFQGSSQHEVLIVMQDDVQVYHGVFDTMAACFQQLPHTAVLGPLINAMNVGEKATDMRVNFPGRIESPSLGVLHRRAPVARSQN